MCVVCDVLCDMCHIIKTMGTKRLVAMNEQIMILGIDSKFGMSILKSNSLISFLAEARRKEKPQELAYANRNQ